MAGDPEKDAAYAAQIAKGLDGAYERAPHIDVDPGHDKIVIFSDHHKGGGDLADDFRKSEHAYTMALGYYLEAGYKLMVLGDAEELWEEDAPTVLKRYPAVLHLEAQFRDRGGLERFFGNHDDLWAKPRQVRKHLHTFFGDLHVREGLRLRVRRPGKSDATIFLVHGHQGTSESDTWGPLARIPVRFVWRTVQRWTGWSATTPSRDYTLRARHDRAMFGWARDRGPDLVLIAGHTHRPVFARSVPDPPPTRPISDLEDWLAAATKVGDVDQTARIRAELEYARTSRRRPDEAVTVSPPCYFNTGCCSFPDGDITGIEIVDGEIRLVRWPSVLGEWRHDETEGQLDTSRRVLAVERLDDILDLVSAPPAAGSAITEHKVEAPALLTDPQAPDRQPG
jgi:hypothetical protein